MRRERSFHLLVKCCELYASSEGRSGPDCCFDESGGKEGLLRIEIG